jgi:hypothetical protein
VAALKIDTGPIEATDFAAEVPKAKWPLLVGARRHFCAARVPSDCRHLLRFVEEAKLMCAELGYADLRDFIRRGLEIDPELVEWAIRGLKALKPNEPVPFADAVALGKKYEEAKPAQPSGAPKGNRNAAAKKDTPEPKQPLPGNNSSARGNREDYLLGRIKAKAEKGDEKALAVVERIKSGEVTSARQAAHEAGILKPVDPVAKLLRSIGKLSDGDRERLYIRLQVQPIRGVS